MGRYKAFIKPSALKELAAVPKRKARRKIIKRIEGLSDEPRPPESEKLASRERYRLRQRQYRIVYAIDDRNEEITVYRIGQP